METVYEDKLLNTISDLAAVGYSVMEVAEVIEMEPEHLKEILMHPSHPLSKAFLKGKNQLKFSARKSLADLAANGSVPAAMKILELIQIQDERHY